VEINFAKSAEQTSGDLSCIVLVNRHNYLSFMRYSVLLADESANNVKPLWPVYAGLQICYSGDVNVCGRVRDY
jgi:hypothetical protein